jgi:hypothetical protein
MTSSMRSTNILGEIENPEQWVSEFVQKGGQ